MNIFQNGDEWRGATPAAEIFRNKTSPFPMDEHSSLYTDLSIKNGPAKGAGAQYQLRTCPVTPSP